MKMNLHEPVCGPGRAWMQLTSCYLIGWGWLTSTNVYSGNGVLYYDSLWQTYLVRKRYIFPPQIIAQNHAFKVKVIQTCQILQSAWFTPLGPRARQWRDGESDTLPVKNQGSQCPLRVSPAEQRAAAFKSTRCLEEPFNFPGGTWHSEQSQTPWK